MAKRRIRRSLKAAVYGLAVGAVLAVALHLTKSPPQQVATSRADLRNAVLVTPEGDGNCRRVVYSNDAPRMIETRTVPCATAIRSEHAHLPPVLQGYQDALQRG